MNTIEVMNNEHKNVLRMLKVVRACCYKVLNEKEINYDDFYKIVEFIVEYADKHHHRKEEIMLFNRMVENLGPIAQKLVQNGMLVEHDLGRLHITQLKEALEDVKKGDEERVLDVIANAISYTHLLQRHIDKEDNVVYKYAQRELDKNILDLIDKECKEFEEKNEDVKIKYLSLLEELERKYNVEG